MSRQHPEPREYRGILLMPEQPNAAGIRWTARIGDGMTRRADTLAGIKRLVRDGLNSNRKAP